MTEEDTLIFHGQRSKNRGSGILPEASQQTPKITPNPLKVHPTFIPPSPTTPILPR